MSEPWKKLGRELADELDERPGEAEELARAKQAVLREIARPKRRAPVVWAVAAAAAVALAVGVGYRARGGDVSYAVVTSGAPVAAPAGVWLDVPEGEERAVQFSEGSTVLLAATSRARVSAVRPDGATVTLERGRATVSVSHRPGASWSFLAGPFDVRVTGTRFELDWDPAKELFLLAMQDGSVRVTGPTLGDGATLVAGQRLRVSLRDGAVPAASSASPRPSAEIVPLPASSTAPSDAVPSARRAPVDDAPPTWRDLAARGEYGKAMTAAEADGVASILGQGSAADLLLFADVARFSGKPALAREALLAVRTRFPGSQQAALAAFSLGRMGGGEALAFFERYLAEAPNGSLAREAMGRVMELQQAGGNAAGARETAKRYLARFPGGPHAALAKALVGAEPDGGAGRVLE